MANSYENLRKKMSRESRARAEEGVRAMFAEMSLKDLRAAYFETRKPDSCITARTLSYPARIYPDDGAWSVEFRDVPGALTWGETKEEAVFHAQEALDLMLSGLIEDNDDIAWPGKARKTDVMIPVSAHVAAPLLLYLTRQQQGLSMAEVARRLNVSYQAYQRMEKVGGNLTLKNLERAAAAMGAAVELRMIPLSEIGKSSKRVTRR